MSVLAVVAVMLAAGVGLLWMVAHFGKDAVAGRQTVGWVRGKGSRW